MSSVEALQGRVDTVRRLLSLVRTMKALSAAGVRQCEEAVRSLAEYRRTLELGLGMAVGREAPEGAGRDRRRDGRLAAVVFGGDQGLCGRFNERVALHAARVVAVLEPEGGRRLVFCVGGRLAERLQDLGLPVAGSLPAPGSLAGITPLVHRLLVRLEAWREEGVERVVLVHHRHREGGLTGPVTVPFLPVDPARLPGARRRARPGRGLPLYTMDRQRLLAALVRQYLFVTLFRACAESLASEHAVRLLSLQGAERNIEGRLEELRGELRRLRQDLTTAEILDLNAGFQALADGDAGAPRVSR